MLRISRFLTSYFSWTIQDDENLKYFISQKYNWTVAQPESQVFAHFSVRLFTHDVSLFYLLDLQEQDFC